MRSRRLIWAALLTAALAPAVWLRSPPENDRPNRIAELALTPLAAKSPASWPAGLTLVGAWHLTSRNNRFGGYSALLPGSGETLTAVSDSGMALRFARPGARRALVPEFSEIGTASRRGCFRDIEAATEDRPGGTRWFAYEGCNAIRRFAGSDGIGLAAEPPAMRGWAVNGGPESMVRLADGRFIVLSEVAPWLSAGGRPGLLFPFDPVAGAKPVEFTFRPPLGYDPSDMAALPDGRVVILLRALDLPFAPFFKGMLLVADPAAIAAGREWPWRKLAELDDPLPRDNYEGLAIVPDRSGVTLWLISDDNHASFQRTLLLQLHWDVPPRSAATGSGQVKPARSPS